MLQALNILEISISRRWGMTAPVTSIRSTSDEPRLCRSDFYYVTRALHRPADQGNCCRRTTRASAPDSSAGHNDPDIRPAIRIGSSERTLTCSILENWHSRIRRRLRVTLAESTYVRSGTTAVEAADEEGWAGGGDAERRLDTGRCCGHTASA